MTSSRCVIVAGLPRSGTSWLAKGLSFAPGFSYYREPDNYDRVALAQERFAWLYLTAEQDDPEYHDLMTRACEGRIATAFTRSKRRAASRTPRNDAATSTTGMANARIRKV